MSTSEEATKQGIESQPLQLRGSSATMRFEALSPEESGIDLINPLDPENPMSFLYYSGMSCGGVAIGDGGGDGTFRNVLNDGSGNFSLRALPRLAQASPTFGAALADLDGDLNLDVYLVQNLFTPQQETGRFDGGLSLLLSGRG